MAGRSPDQMRAQLVQRYATPGLASAPQYPIDMNWYAAGENCRSALARAKPALHAEEDAYHKLKINLLEGLEIERAWEASVQRAATGGAPATSSF
ncbi:hypothetical protein [uncultured Sphingomonas sp.]|uniref:hypothetical protein n=1 Tax=uncultured Sphingomonas sp. TaxID=158754 RepID=UPI0025828814|nr:hypothetical protein [uncultured Sphingomonas sp.]